MNRRLQDRDFLAGEYSIADIAAYPWVRPYRRQGQDLADFPNLDAWYKRIHDRPAVARAIAIGKDVRAKWDLASDRSAQSVLFGQRAR
jgi:GST-like protein